MILLDWQGTHSSQFSQTHPLGPISSKEVLCSRFVRDGLPLRLCSVPFCSQRMCGTEPHNLIQSLRLVSAEQLRLVGELHLPIWRLLFVNYKYVLYLWKH